MSDYNKSYKTAAELVEHLSSKGLTIGDAAEAELFLNEVGFDRLRIYFLSRRETSQNKPFKEGTRFEDIKDIYDFDENLRVIMFKYCSKVETILKTAISEEVCRRHGCIPYDNKSAYRDEKSRRESNESLVEMINKARPKDRRLDHFYEKYKSPNTPPFWTVREFMTFGSLNYHYRRFSIEIKKSVQESFGIKKDNILPQWIDCLVDLRNACAHNDRVFNRKFQKQPTFVKNVNAPSCKDTSKVAALCQIMEAIIASRGPKIDITAEINLLLGQHPAVNADELGF